jgi:hypothetical protein
LGNLPPAPLNVRCVAHSDQSLAAPDWLGSLDDLYLDQIATVTAIVVATRCTDHLASLIGTTVKQFGLARSQLVQKPAASSLHVPDLAGPLDPIGSRTVFPSGVKVILNLVPLVVAAVNGCPVKNIVLMSLGFIASAALAALVPSSNKKIAADGFILLAVH